MTPDSSISPDDRALVARYYAGLCDPAERTAAEALLASHPRVQRFGRIFDQAVTHGTHGVTAEEMERSLSAWRSSLERASKDDASSTSSIEDARRPYGSVGNSSRSWILGSVAVVAIAIVGLLDIRVGTRSTSGIPSQMYQTAAGQNATLCLADGSVVTLAPGTTVHVTSRAVAVVGEAYFQITPKVGRPFRVQTANADVDVLGTAFSVRQYPADRMSRVVVADGKVALRRHHHASGIGEAPTVLTARMLGQVTDSTVAVTSGIDVGDYLGWRDGRLVFDNTPLHDVVAELARAYGATIRVADTLLARQPMTMGASVQEQPLTQVLDLLTRAVDAHYTRVGNVIVIAPGRVSTQRARFNSLPKLEPQYGR